MKSERELFWTSSSYAVVGQGASMPFPKLTYQGLKQNGKTVYPVDASVPDVDGDRTFADLKSLPAPVEAVVLELPESETEKWVRQAADAGVKKLWIHMGSETPEALEIARKAGMSVCHGTCAVMYLNPTGPHAVHKWIMKLFHKF